MYLKGNEYFRFKAQKKPFLSTKNKEEIFCWHLGGHYFEFQGAGLIFAKKKADELQNIHESIPKEAKVTIF